MTPDCHLSLQLNTVAFQFIEERAGLSALGDPLLQAVLRVCLQLGDTWVLSLDSSLLIPVAFDLHNGNNHTELPLFPARIYRWACLPPSVMLICYGSQQLCDIFKDLVLFLISFNEIGVTVDRSENKCAHVGVDVDVDSDVVVIRGQGHQRASCKGSLVSGLASPSLGPLPLLTFAIANPLQVQCKPIATSYSPVQCQAPLQRKSG